MTTRTPSVASSIVSAVFTLTLVVSASTSAWAAPPAAAIKNSDYRLLTETSTISSDWSETALYDLSRTLEFNAAVVGIEYPDQAGYVLLLFTMIPPEGLSSDVRVDTRTVFSAILQTPEEMERLEISSRELSRGTTVRLVGWPPTQNNGLEHVMLIESVTDIAGSKRYGLHDDNFLLKEREARLKAERDQEIAELR